MLVAMRTALPPEGALAALGRSGSDTGARREKARQNRAFFVGLRFLARVRVRNLQ